LIENLAINVARREILHGGAVRYEDLRTASAQLCDVGESGDSSKKGRRKIGFEKQ